MGNGKKSRWSHKVHYGTIYGLNSERVKKKQRYRIWLYFTHLAIKPG